MIQIYFFEKKERKNHECQKIKYNTIINFKSSSNLSLFKIS